MAYGYWNLTKHTFWSYSRMKNRRLFPYFLLPLPSYLSLIIKSVTKTFTDCRKEIVEQYNKFQTPIRPRILQRSKSGQHLGTHPADRSRPERHRRVTRRTRRSGWSCACTSDRKRRCLSRRQSARYDTHRRLNSGLKILEVVARFNPKFEMVDNF